MPDQAYEWPKIKQAPPNDYNGPPVRAYQHGIVFVYSSPADINAATFKNIAKGVVTEINDF